MTLPWINDKSHFLYSGTGKIIQYFEKSKIVLKLTNDEHASVFCCCCCCCCWENRAKESFWFQWDNNSFFLTTIRSKDRLTKIRQFSRKKLFFWMLFQRRTLEVMLQTGASHKNAGKKKAKQIKIKAYCNLVIMRTITPQPRAMMQSA